MNEIFAIGEVAERLGLTVDTLRYYERAGVIPAPERDVGGRRRYTATDIHLLEVLVHLRDTGMPLAGIAEFTRLVQQDPGGVAERLAILQHHRAAVVAALDRLTRSLTVIDSKVTDYTARMKGRP